jgi:hypothetical protein
MKSVFIFLFGVLTFSVQLPAAETNATDHSKAASLAPSKIGALEATNYYNQTMIVTGKVAQVTIRPKVTFLNLDKRFPDSPFAIVIIHGKSTYYGNANALKGKSIEIRGKIQNYKGKPEIVLDSTNQLTVLNFTNSIRLPSAPATPAPANMSPDESATNSFPEIM